MNVLVIGYHLDTNGGNGRFVKAAQRFGDDERVLKVVALANRADPAGVVARYHLASEKTANLSIRAVHRVQDYTNFPYDILWTRNNQDEVAQLVADADVIHLNNSSRALNAFRFSSRNKPQLLHHHGTSFRNATDQMYAEAKARRQTQAVSTIDLTRYDPKNLHWLPICYDVDALQAYGKANGRPKDGMIRIAHAPTNRENKHTEAFLAAIKTLQGEGLPVEVDLIERVTNAECLRRKAEADVLFDQLWLGYGCNSIEAWALGLPVVSGADPWTTEQMRQKFGELPFAEANTATLVDILRRMVTSKDYRAEYRAKGLAHVRKWHDELPVMERLAELYMLTIKNAGHGRTLPVETAAVTFRYEGRQHVRVWGEEVPFNNGVYTTTDLDTINHLRRLAQRKNFGVEEVA